MVLQIVSTILPIVLIAALGYLWSWRNYAYDGHFVSLLVMNIATPCLILSTLLDVELSSALLIDLSVVTVSGLAILLVINGLLLKVMGRSYRAYLPALTFANTGNMGIPIALFAFGDYALALALVVFMVTSLVHFTLGVAIVGGHHPLKALFKSPVFYAATISVVMLLNTWQLPTGLHNAIRLLGNMAIPLMLFSLGISLHSLKVQDIGSSLVFALARLFIGTGVGFGIAGLFGLQGVQAGVVIILFAMPSAVFNYLLAMTYRREPESVAGIVVFSTLLSLVSLPLLLAYLLPS